MYNSEFGMFMKIMGGQLLDDKFVGKGVFIYSNGDTKIELSKDGECAFETLANSGENCSCKY